MAQLSRTVMTTYRIERARDSESLARQASETIATQISLVLEQRDRCTIALSGGSTPAKAYSLLGQSIPLGRVDVSSAMSAGLPPMMHPAMPACCAAPFSHPGLSFSRHPVPTVELRALRPCPGLADQLSQLCSEHQCST